MNSREINNDKKYDEPIRLFGGDTWAIRGCTIERKHTIRKGIASGSAAKVLKKNNNQYQNYYGDVPEGGIVSM